MGYRLVVMGHSSELAVKTVPYVAGRFSGNSTVLIFLNHAFFPLVTDDRALASAIQILGEMF